MRYIDFQNTFSDFTIFSTQAIEKVFPGFDRKVLVAWQKKGYIHKLRNNWYCFTERQFTEQDLFLIANKIYHPSYISLAAALSYYQFIPEGVFLTTSVSTLKTMRFETPKGSFDYRNIKPHLFFGYKLEQQIKNRLAGWCKIATPEKAIIDFLYLNPQYKEESDFEGLRFNWNEISLKVDVDKMGNYLNYIRSHALTKRTTKLLNLLYA